MRGQSKHLFELHVEDELDRRYSQNGIWERGILCTQCDNKLGEYDAYAYEILPEDVGAGKRTFVAPGATTVDLGIIDVRRFKLFLAALVWRASRARHPLFQNVKVGRYGKRLKELLLGKNGYWLNHIDCVYVYFQPPRYRDIMWQPYSRKCEGVNTVQFYLYPWKLLIKLDERPFGPTFQPLGLRGGSPTIGIEMNDFSEGETQRLIDLQGKLKSWHAKRNWD